MGLDIEIRTMRPIACKHCGRIADFAPERTICSSGRSWWPAVRAVGYGNEHYGKYMRLTQADAMEFVRVASAKDFHDATRVCEFIKDALEDGRVIEVEADW